MTNTTVPRSSRVRRGDLGPEERRPSLALLVPLGIAVAFLLVGPLLVLLVRSIGGLGAPSLEVYGSVLSSGAYLRSFAVTTVLAVASTVLALILCVPAALYLERESTRTSRAIAAGLTIPLSLPGIVIGFFVILIFGTTGLVPTLSGELTGSAVGRIAYTFTGLLIGYLYFNIPRVILTVRGAVGEISEEVIDASRTLGASPFQVFMWVIVPTLRPAIAAASALSLATAYGAFGTAATLSRGFRVVPLDIAASFTERFEPQVAATLSVLLAVVTTAILVIVNRLGVRKELS